jgi:hypothetical protein
MHPHGSDIIIRLSVAKMDDPVCYVYTDELPNIFAQDA